MSSTLPIVKVLSLLTGEEGLLEKDVSASPSDPQQYLSSRDPLYYFVSEDSGHINKLKEIELKGALRTTTFSLRLPVEEDNEAFALRDYIEDMYQDDNDHLDFDYFNLCHEVFISESQFSTVADVSLSFSSLMLLKYQDEEGDHGLLISLMGCRDYYFEIADYTTLTGNTFSAALIKNMTESDEQLIRDGMDMKKVLSIAKYGASDTLRIEASELMKSDLTSLRVKEATAAMVFDRFLGGSSNAIEIIGKCHPFQPVLYNGATQLSYLLDDSGELSVSIVTKGKDVFTKDALTIGRYTDSSALSFYAAKEKHQSGVSCGEFKKATKTPKASKAQ